MKKSVLIVSLLFVLVACAPAQQPQIDSAPLDKDAQKQKSDNSGRPFVHSWEDYSFTVPSNLEYSIFSPNDGREVWFTARGTNPKLEDLPEVFGAPTTEIYFYDNRDGSFEKVYDLPTRMAYATNIGEYDVTIRRQTPVDGFCKVQYFFAGRQFIFCNNADAVANSPLNSEVSLLRSATVSTAVTRYIEGMIRTFTFDDPDRPAVEYRMQNAEPWPNQDLVSVNRNTGEQVVLLKDTQDIQEKLPNWSFTPISKWALDGKAFFAEILSETDAPPSRVWSFDIETKEFKPLKNGKFQGWQYALSPNRRNIAQAPDALNDDSHSKVLNLLDMVDDEVHVAVELTEECESFNGGAGGLSSLFDIEWLDDTTIRYGVFNQCSDDIYSKKFLELRTVDVAEYVN